MISNAYDITPEGEAFAEKLDAFDVEHNWLPTERVYWLSGKKKESDLPGKTHCSAFVSAVCKKLNVEMLMPPEHSTNFLANAQCDWLDEKGPGCGWSEIKSPFEAQESANKGMLVLVVFKAPRTSLHGHIAIVRPSGKTIEQISEEGPQIIQAGMMNYNSTNVKNGFMHHKGAWIDAKKFKVRFLKYSDSGKQK